MYEIICRSCRRRPSEIDYIRQHASERGMSPADYVKKYDDTLFGQFIHCEDCQKLNRDMEVADGGEV
jgi:hypothetical protein